MSRVSTLARASALLLAIGLPGAAAAQALPAPTPMPELRVDAIAGDRPAVQLGAGLQIPAGYYVRIGVDAAAGVPVGRREATPRRADARADLLVRFLLDPFRQSAYGLSAGAGLSVRAEPGDRVRPVLLVATEVEGRRAAHGWVPALQVGLGGGARFGLLLRRAARLSR